MLVDFFFHLKKLGLTVSLREFLDLLTALKQGLARYRVEEFYFLARTVLIKDESQYDRFDLAFNLYFKGLEKLPDLTAFIPDTWLQRLADRHLTAEERAQVQAVGDWQQLMDLLAMRLREQQERHEGGDTWVGTGGTSPFGAGGYNPEGVRIGQHESRYQQAVKIWERREFKNFDSGLELGTRHLKLALRRLRQFAREGAAQQFDLEQTIHATARNAGYLDLKMRPERHNAVKVLLLLDVGGSMDYFTRLCEELFSAARSEFKHLEYYYFHNFIYEFLWRDNRRRFEERVPTWDILHTYGSDYKVIFVGDASMSPYEIIYPGASVEHDNPEAGQVWLKRMQAIYSKTVWLNPVTHSQWKYVQSIGMIKRLMGDRMYPLTLSGLDEAMKALMR
ncbi:VWA domain-containing protein [Thioflexithrix psekupsensis]|uniref:VWA domain-containing protein n=1 Tax=Thioflexithrix psekupsensis TaxID=1570016 RepID=A0A251XCJ8_9GAMM|nr:VWA domain-containing protein [Thioflexithrix psekupsensis]